MKVEKPPIVCALEAVLDKTRKPLYNRNMESRWKSSHSTTMMKRFLNIIYLRLLQKKIKKSCKSFIFRMSKLRLMNCLILNKNTGMNTEGKHCAELHSAFLFVKTS